MRRTKHCWTSSLPAYSFKLLGRDLGTPGRTLAASRLVQHVDGDAYVHVEHACTLLSASWRIELYNAMQSASKSAVSWLVSNATSAAIAAHEGCENLHPSYEHRVDDPDSYNFCPVPNAGQDAILYASLALVATCLLQGRLSALWVFIAGAHSSCDIETRSAVCLVVFQILYANKLYL